MSFRSRNNFINSQYSISDYGQVIKKNINISGTFTGSVYPEPGGGSSIDNTGSFNGNFTGTFSGNFSGTFEGVVVGAIDGTGNANELAFFIDSNTLSSSPNIVRDSINRVGFGVGTPNESVSVSGALSIQERLGRPTNSTNYGKIFVDGNDAKPYFLDENSRIYGMTPFGITSGSIQYVSGNVFSASDNFRWIHGSSELRITASDNPTFSNPSVSIGSQAPKFQLDDKSNAFGIPADWATAPGLDFAVKNASGGNYHQGIKWISNRTSISPVFVAGIFPKATDTYDGSQSNTVIDFYNTLNNTSRFIMSVGRSASNVNNVPGVIIGGQTSQDSPAVLNVQARTSTIVQGTNVNIVALQINSTNNVNKTNTGGYISFNINYSAGAGVNNTSEASSIGGLIHEYGGASINDVHSSAVTIYTISSGSDSGNTAEVARFARKIFYLGMTGSILERTGSMRLAVSGVIAVAYTSSLSPAAADNFNLFYAKNNSRFYWRAAKNGALSGTEYDLSAVELTSSVAKISGSLKTPFRTVSSNYNITYGDSFIKVTSSADSIGVILPSAIGWAGLEYTIKRSGANPVSITGSSSQTIDGESVYVISVNSGSVTVVSDNEGWLIKSTY